MADLGAKLVLEIVEQLSAGTTNPVTQEKSLATKAPRLSKEMGAIDWSRTAQKLRTRCADYNLGHALLRSGDGAK